MQGLGHMQAAGHVCKANVCVSLGLHVILQGPASCNHVFVLSLILYSVLHQTSLHGYLRQYVAQTEIELLQLIGDLSNKVYNINATLGKQTSDLGDKLAVLEQKQVQSASQLSAVTKRSRCDVLIPTGLSVSRCNTLCVNFIIPLNRHVSGGCIGQQKYKERPLSNTKQTMVLNSYFSENCLFTV